MVGPARVSGRPEKTQWLVIGVVLLLFASSVLVAGAFGRSASKGPNIVFILTDDQSIDTLPANPPVMPYLQSQVQDPSQPWVDFTDAHISTPLCCPSRSTILSGQYAHHTGVLRNEDGHKFDDTNTLATWLHGAGYYTGLFGKYLNRYPFDKAPFTPPGWDQFVAREHGDETTVYFNYNLYDNGETVYYGVRPQDYMPDVLTTKAVDFIRNAPADHPFFLYFAPTAPHAPWLPPPRYQQSNDSTVIAHPPDYNEADVSDKPAWVQRQRSITNLKGRLLDYQHQHENDALLGVDDSVRAIINALQQQGDLANTVVVYMTDNGYSFGEHRWVGKRCAYTECTQTPFFVRFPGAVSPVVNTVISNADIAPTFAALAGTTPQLPEDGRSLLPLLDGSAQFRRPGILLEWAGDSDIPQYWALRTKRWLYVDYPMTGEHELYDLIGTLGRADPYLLNNVAANPKYARVKQQLSLELAPLTT
jgi:arylsulfatase A-like enzyme